MRTLKFEDEQVDDVVTITELQILTTDSRNAERHPKGNLDVRERTVVIAFRIQ